MESSEYSPKSIDSRANAVQRVSQPSQQQTSVQGPLQRTIDGSPRQTAQRQQIVTSGSNGLSTSEPIQRKAVFKNPDSENIKTLKNKIISQLQLKNNLFNEKEKEQIERFCKFAGYDIFKMLYLILNDDTTNYGTFNLENDQHLILLYHEIEKLSNSGKSLPEIGKEISDSWRKSAERRKQLRDIDSPDLANTYQTILLGTGASIANYINVNGHALDPLQTLIIGKVQPWDPSSPESRGINFINHPMHMTSPERHTTKLPTQLDGSDETFQDNPAKLTEDINKALAGFKQKNATIRKISKENGLYKISTDEGNFYATKVISGLGIGPHKVDGINRKANGITASEDKETEKIRVMDLDAFQRQLGNDQSPISQALKAAKEAGSRLRIGIAGPNAGVDAAYTATLLGGIDVEWIVSREPAIADGMGNKIKDDKVSGIGLHFDYLDGWTIEGKKVKMHMSGKETRQTDGAKFAEKMAAWKDQVRTELEVEVDYLVIAQGPDVKKLWDLFDKSITEDLALQMDDQGRFGNHQGSDFWQGPVETSLRSAGYNVFWEGIFERVKKVLPNKPALAIAEQLQESIKHELTINHFKEINLQRDVAIGYGSKDGSFQIIGGSAIRTLDLTDTTNKAKEEDKKGSKMRRVNKTLSSPTILNNDQLTPIRSQIEAQANYTPGYVGTEESNFVTDDQTMIAAQIASHYGNIPPSLANYITQMIIQDRHTNGVKPGNSQGQGSRAFVDKWKTKLESIHQLLARERIIDLAPKA